MTKNIWQLLKEAFADDDDDDNINALAHKARDAFGISHPEFSGNKKMTATTHKRISQSPQMYKIGTGQTDDTTSAMKDAGLDAPKQTQVKQQKDYSLQDIMKAERYADQVIGVSSRAELKDILTMFTNSMNITRALTPGQMSKFVSRLELAYSESQAKKILVDIAKELREKNQ